jgi:hypothetical protein
VTHDHELAADEGEYLDPGYDAGTAAGDNLLNDFCRAEVEGWRRWALAAAGRHGSDPDLGVSWADTGCLSVSGNHSQWSRPIDVDQAAAVVEALSTHYGRAPGGPYVVFSAFPTPDLHGLGMRAVGHPPLMVRTAGQPVEAGHPNLSLRIERVSTTQQLLDFERTIIEAFPVEELVPWQPGSFVPAGLLDDDAWHLLVGYDEDGRPVATSAAFVTDHVVDVTWVSCRPESRRRGFGEAMTWGATLIDPSKPAMLIASDDGLPLYQRMGYVTLLRFTLWIGSRPPI